MHEYKQHLITFFQITKFFAFQGGEPGLAGLDYFKFFADEA